MAIHTQHTRGWLHEVDQALQEYRAEQSHEGIIPQAHEELSIRHELKHIEEEFRTAKHHLRSWRTHHAYPQSALEDTEDSSCIICEECLDMPYQQEKALHRCKRRLARYDRLKSLFQEIVREGNISDNIREPGAPVKLYAMNATQ